MLDPLPLYYKPSRYWLIKSIGKLLTSGTRRVEFADFWMGDQFCSLVFTLSNFYLFGCVYARGFDSDWTKCGVSRSPQWAVSFVLASLPLFIRVVQSLKRYYDSGLVTHLINGGKYGSGILSNLFFYIWRHQGTTGRGTIFALWLLWNTISSIYSSSWDILMDWSFLSRRAKYPLLRSELVYTDWIPLYYVAIITNILLRFIWIIYIPIQGPNMFFRTFIGGLLEMLRRWQWNFYRLENEHLGNMDQYRVTREVPLPYSFDDAHAVDADDGDDDEEDEALQMAAARVRDRRRRPRPKRTVAGGRSKKIG
ncbi:EXS-domain-containing protein [Lyophyllum atratum]|nr:EXS-domain-containing protein [Lyophyllum atratum]